MKMAAFRDERDMRDLGMLFDHLGITTADQAVDIAVSLYGETVSSSVRAVEPNFCWEPEPSRNE